MSSSHAYPTSSAEIDTHAEERLGSIAIRVSNLSKCYQIYDTPHDRLKQFLAPRFQRLTRQTQKQYYHEFWALQDVSFEVKKGETVGIVGRNGSGKSTLLQIICGTLTPTGGTVETRGRVAALLELGSGFNPDFTGRENVYLNASVLGLSRQEIDARFDDIAAFADIGQFIEQPIKTYSSGMMVRLAFAVAINVDPDILIIDEALSVGDELFQRKCFSRIETIRKSGATILFVSHSGSAVVELCDRALLMDSGERLAAGLPKQIVGRYQKLLYAPTDKRQAIREEIRRADGYGTPLPANGSDNKPPENGIPDNEEQKTRESFDPHLKSDSVIEYASDGVHIQSPILMNLAGEQVNGLARGEKYRYCYKVRFERGASSVRFGMSLKTTSGLSLGGAYSAANQRDAISVVEPGVIISVEFTFNCSLNPGTYFMNAGVFGIIDKEETVLHRLADVIVFRVVPVGSNTATGIVDFGCVSMVSFDE